MRDALLTWLADAAWRRPWTIVVSAILLAVVSGGYAALRLELNADTDDLISPSRPFMEEYRRYLDEFGDLEYIYVAVAVDGDPQRARAAVDTLTGRLQGIEDLRGVYSGVTPHEQLRLATRAMPDADLADLAQASWGFAPFVDAASPGDVVRHATGLLNGLMRPGGTADEHEQLAAGARFALSPIAAAREGSPSREALGPLLDPPDHEYFVSETGGLYFITVIPDKDFGTLAVIEEPLRLIREAMDDVRRLYPDVEMGLTGKAVLQADEMATTAEDTTVAAILAFGLVAGLFMVILRGFYAPALAAVAFLCAGAWTYGFATLAIGYLNLLSVVFALVLVGIGFDFGVHLIARYNEYRATRGVQESLRAAVLHCGPANITSAFTSAAAFLMALFTPFRGLQELGLVAGAGLLFCLVSMMVVLPALLAVFERSRERRPLHPTTAAPELTPGVLGWVLARPGTVLAVALAGTATLLVANGRVGFEDNLLELQAPRLESVHWEHRIIAESPSMTWFGAIIADNETHVADVVRRAQGFGTVGMVRSALVVEDLPGGAEVTGLVKPDTARRDRLRAALHDRGEGLPVVEDNGPLTGGELQAAARLLDLLAAGAVAEAPEEARQMQTLALDLQWLAERIQPGHADATELRRRLSEGVHRVGASLGAMLEGDREPIGRALPAALRDQYVSSATGRYLVLVHPRDNVWEYQAMHDFVADLRAIDPRVTGAPIATYESMHDMRTAFAVMAVLAFVVVMGLVWIDFRSVGYAVLAMAPLVLGLLWLTEIMGLAGISFNLANFFSISILLGVTVDGAVHILHRYREGGPSRLHLGSTRRAVILTSMTTLIGFGCLMLAEHRGLRSLGMVMAIGSAACLTACLVVLPAFLAWREGRRGAGRW